jgi:two-component system chemotaxis sensor kinase CheA
MGEDLDLIQAFTEEAAELLEGFEQGLLDLERTPGDAEVLNRIFRAAHTIKGNSAMLGFTGVAQFTHTLEDVLDRMRKGKLQVTVDGMNLLLRSLDMLKSKLATLHRPEEAPDSTRLAEELRAHADGGNTAAPVVEPPPAEVIALQALSESEEGSDAAEHEEAERPLLGEILVAQQAATPEQISQALRQQRRVGEILVEQKVATPEQVQRALEAQATVAPKGDAASIRVHTEKVDKLVNLVGEMVIAQSMLAQIASKFTLDQLPRLVEAVTAMERHSRELQERVMAVRMQPIKAVFTRFHRLVRDLNRSLGKSIRLEVSGEETELDKTVIDRIGDPLTHLVRNSVDHGIEPPEVRRELGKPAEGVVRLRAYQQGGNIFVEVGDDGKGLDTARIRRKGIDVGMIRDGEIMSDDQVHALIFRPGFSTAERVTDLSGRGVGMDVVRRNIESLGGQVTIESRTGRGSAFTIKLPLTLAILDGLSVRVGGTMYIIPLVNITESIRPKAGQVHTIAGRGEVLDMRGHVIPVLRLYEILGVTPEVTDPTQSLLVMVENGAERVALLVDELLGQHQVVIKSLETNYRRIDGISGATIMGDGQVALILDVPGLARLAAQGPALAAA